MTRRKKILLEILSVVGIIAALFPFSMYQDMRIVAKREGRAMALQYNWHASRVLVIWRKKLLDEPADERGLVYRALTYLHRKVYENALSKLPPEDGERVLFWSEYALEPFEDFTNSEHVNILMPQVVEALERLLKDDSQTTYCMEVGRYYDAQNLLTYFYSHLRYWSPGVHTKGHALYGVDALLSSIFLRMDERPLYASRHGHGEEVPLMLAQRAYMMLEGRILGDKFRCRPQVIVDTFPAIAEKAQRILDETEKNPRIQFTIDGRDKSFFTEGFRKELPPDEALTKLRNTCPPSPQSNPTNGD